jgi:hypothetical protein
MTKHVVYFMMTHFFFGVLFAEDERDRNIWELAGRAYLMLASEKDESKRSEREANVIFALMGALNAKTVVKLEDVISYAGNPDRVYKTEGADKIFLYEKISGNVSRVFMVSADRENRVYSITFNNTGSSNFSTAIPYVGEKPRPPAMYYKTKSDAVIP